MKKITIAIVIIAIIIIGGLSLKKSSDNKAVNTSGENLNTEVNQLASSSPMVSPAGTETKTYKLSEVALHNRDGNCWTTISGKVYDLTTWPEKHPSGDKAIFAICGIDGTSAFEKAHKDQPDPAKVLDGFYIGELSI